MRKSCQSSPKQPTQPKSMFLDDLKQGSNGPITIMVCRKWDVNNINGRYLSTDFIISDKKGNVMHCVARNKIAHYFIDRLQEGTLYSLRDFTVQPNRDEYKIMKDSPYIIELHGSTRVTKTTDDVVGFIRYPFQLVPFDALTPTESKYFVDVIRYIAQLGQPSLKPTGAQTVDFNLMNECGRHVRVTLWGALGNALLATKAQKKEPYAIILTSMSVKYYLGQLCLPSSTSTLVIDNEDIPALNELNSALSTIDLKATNLPVMQPHAKVGTISQLLQWARVKKKDDVAIFRNVVKITNVHTKNGWFNFTCTSGKCRKGVSRRSNSFWCESCDTNVPFPRPRFRLQLDVRDESGEVVVVLFDETAEKLVNTTAKALLDEQNEDESNDTSALPHVLENLINSNHMFELKSTTYYQYGDYESFNCAQVVIPEMEIHVSSLDPDGQLANNKNRTSSSSKGLQQISPLSTPAKASEQKKRKRYTDVSGPENLADDIVEGEGITAKGRKNKRCIVDSESDVEVFEDLDRGKDGVLNG